MKLHLACGSNILKDWVNLDLEPQHNSVIQHDLTQPLPFLKDTIDLMYSEHFIEHIPKKAAYSLIADCFQKLKPNGVIRLSTPNLERLTRQYRYVKTDSWRNMGWVPSTACDLLNEGLKSWGHQYVYDWHEIEKLLRLNGFINISRKKWGDSSIHAFQNIESRHNHGEIIVEATKPAIQQLNKPKVSVVIGSYNHANYIGHTLDSVLNQTFQDFEIIVTDDGSSDGTADVVETYTDNRIKLKRFAQNKGACFSVNDTIMRAQGEYIALLSSDDLFFRDKLQKQVDFLEAHPEVGAVFALAEFIDEHGQSLSLEGQEKHGATFKEHNRSQIEWLWRLFQMNCLCHPTILIRKTCYDEIGLYNPSLRSLPDYEMWVKLLQKTNIHIIQEPLIYMRKFSNEANESGDRPEQLRRASWEHIKVLKRFLSTPDHLWQPIINHFFDPTTFSHFVSYKREFEFAALCMHTRSTPHLMAAIQVLSSIDDVSDETAIPLYRTLNELTAQVHYKLDLHKDLNTILMEQK